MFQFLTAYSHFKDYLNKFYISSCIFVTVGRTQNICFFCPTLNSQRKILFLGLKRLSIFWTSVPPFLDHTTENFHAFKIFVFKIRVLFSRFLSFANFVQFHFRFILLHLLHYMQFVLSCLFFSVRVIVYIYFLFSSFILFLVFLCFQFCIFSVFTSWPYVILCGAYEVIFVS